MIMRNLLKNWKPDWLTGLLLGLGLWAGIALVHPLSTLSALLCAFGLARLNAWNGPFSPSWPKTGLYLTMGLAALVMTALLVLKLLAVDVFTQVQILGACLAALLPTGLPVYAALGTMQLQRAFRLHRGTLVKPQALHALGHAQVLVLDAPGLLLRRQPQVHAMAAPLEPISPKNRKGDPSFLMLALAMVFCGQDPADPVESALAESVRQLGYEKKQLLKHYPQITQRETPWILSAHQDKRAIRVFARGTLEQILPECTLLFDGNTRVLQRADQQAIHDAYHSLQGYATDVLVFATGEISPNDDPLTSQIPLAYVGMVGLNYPATENAREILDSLKEMGLVPVVATSSSAKETLALVTLLEKGHTHVNLDPDQKADIVRGWKAQGNLVLATGNTLEDLSMMAAADSALWLGPPNAPGAKQAALLLPHKQFQHLPTLLALAYDECNARQRAARWAILYHALWLAGVITLGTLGHLRNWMIPCIPLVHMALAAWGRWRRSGLRRPIFL